MYYWAERNLIIENGIGRKVTDEDTSLLPLWTDTPEFIASQREQEKQEAQAQIEELEQKALRNLLTLTKGESKVERDYLNSRIAEIEVLRAKL